MLMREEPDAHHEAGGARRRQLGHGAQAHRAQAQFAQRLQKISARQPPRRPPARRAAAISAAGTRMANARPPKSSAERELRRAGRLGAPAVQRQPEPGEHRRQQQSRKSAARTGTSSPEIRSRADRGWCARSANRLSDEPACSNDAQNSAEATNSTRIAAERLRSSGDHPSEPISHQNTTTEMPSSAQPSASEIGGRR